MATSAFSPQERRAIGALGGVYALRMSGLFIILPVFALHAETLMRATPLLAGIAVGIYGLTQAALQIPMGWLSDRLGRRATVLAGLAVFACGSLLAGGAETIWEMIVGRAVQGAGAVSAALTAWAADLSREEARARVLGAIGMMIGAAFLLSLMAGPLLSTWLGTSGVFYLVAALTGIAMLVVAFCVPSGAARPGGGWRRIAEVLRDRRLLRLDLGIGIAHMMLTANFMSLPLAMRDLAGFPVERHSGFYLLVLGGSALFLFPILRMARPRVGRWLWAMLLLLAGCELLLIATRSDILLLGGALLLFFIAFNFLEAQLPTRVSTLCPPEQRGTALGLFTSCQFLGAFLGGLATGVFLEQGQARELYGFLAVLGVLGAWLLSRVESQAAPRLQDS